MDRPGRDHSVYPDESLEAVQTELDGAEVLSDEDAEVETQVVALEEEAEVPSVEGGKP